MVNVAGKRASLDDLNRQLLAIPGVSDGVFIAPPERPGTAARLTALVVASGVSTDEILAALRQCIDPAFLPRPLHRVQKLPRNAAGKLPREALAALLAELGDGT